MTSNSSVSAENDAVVELPSGSPWTLVQVSEKLALRSTLPGAHVFDHAAAALDEALRAGVSVGARVTLALPASWLVNNPATSRVLRAWRAPSALAHWVTLVAALEGAERTPSTWSRVESAFVALEGDVPEELDTLECVTKVLALVVPSSVPLLPPKAQQFLAGVAPVAASGPAKSPASSRARDFVVYVQWFEFAAEQHAARLRAFDAARDHAEGGPQLSAAQVLDRALWFDSEGHAHWP